MVQRITRVRSNKISHSSALIEALLADSIEWKEDRDFHYQIVANAINGCPIEILQPEILYRNQGRFVEYKQTLNQLKAQELSFLKEF